jgi:hypothetical protein
MQRTINHLRSIAVAIGIAGAMCAGSATAQYDPTTYRDIEATLGSVPSFFKLFPEEGIAGAWEFKAV